MQVSRQERRTVINRNLLMQMFLPHTALQNQRFAREYVQAHHSELQQRRHVNFVDHMKHQSKNEEFF